MEYCTASQKNVLFSHAPENRLSSIGGFFVPVFFCNPLSPFAGNPFAGFFE